MSGQSRARAQRRAMIRAGVAIAERITIDAGAIEAIEANPEVTLRGFLAYHVDVALEALESRGADLAGTLAITIGEHPDFPGGLTIEAKAARMLPSAELDDCPGCPVDHSADQGVE